MNIAGTIKGKGKVGSAAAAFVAWLSLTRDQFAHGILMSTNELILHFLTEAIDAAKNGQYKSCITYCQSIIDVIKRDLCRSSHSKLEQ